MTRDAGVLTARDAMLIAEAHRQARLDGLPDACTLAADDMRRYWSSGVVSNDGLPEVVDRRTDEIGIVDWEQHFQAGVRIDAAGYLSANYEHPQHWRYGGAA